MRVGRFRAAVRGQDPQDPEDPEDPEDPQGCHFLLEFETTIELERLAISPNTLIENFLKS